MNILHIDDLNNKLGAKLMNFHFLKVSKIVLLKALFYGLLCPKYK